MTRFARAKGSKASNERVPEQPTSWITMKKDLQKSLKEKAEKDGREQMNKMRQVNYENFLEEKAQTSKTTWAQFPKGNSKNKNESAKTKKQVKRLVKPVKENVKMVNITQDLQSNCPVPEVQKKKKSKKNEEAKFEKPQNQENLTKQAPKINMGDENIKIENNSKRKLKKQLKRLQKTTKEISKPDTEGKEKKPRKKKKQRKESKQGTRNLVTNKEKSFQNAKQNQKFTQNQNKKQGQKRKKAKVRDNKEHKRRKSEPAEPEKIMINDKEEEILKYDGFPITKTDYLRLQELRDTLTKKGVPKSEIARSLKGERRRAEKFLARNRKKNCFNCRQGGHFLSQCPKLQEQTIETAGTDICFKCGSTEHTSMTCSVKSDTFKFAQCFICKEQGHIARQCPDNPRGLYPEGGACKICGDVTHFKKDCPQNQEQTEGNTALLSTISDNNLEGLDDEMKTGKRKAHTQQKQKIVKF